MSRVHVLAPAKINLGLEIIDRRPDGYHDIDTIMAMIDLVDDIMISKASSPDVSISGMDDVPVESNLITKALRAFCLAAEIEPRHHIAIEKRIPAPAGMGGGSSDAAAILRAANVLHGEPLSTAELTDLAAGLGADCPFFLHGPAARAQGIGHELTKIDPPSGWVVLAVPTIQHTGKTAALYGALSPGDFSSGNSIDSIEAALGEGQVPHQPLHNAFLRPARTVLQGLTDVMNTFERLGAATSLTGAGPAIYTLVPNQSAAEDLATRLRAELAGTPVICARFLAELPDVVPSS